MNKKLLIIPLILILCSLVVSADTATILEGCPFALTYLIAQPGFACTDKITLGYIHSDQAVDTTSFYGCPYGQSYTIAQPGYNCDGKTLLGYIDSNPITGATALYGCPVGQTYFIAAAGNDCGGKTLLGYVFPDQATFDASLPCVPSCVEGKLVKECGDDGCGGSCGTCRVDEVCSEIGLCVVDVTPEPCDDSDVSDTYPDGKNYFELGTVTTDTGSFTDTCFSDTGLTEYYCLGEAKVDPYSCLSEGDDYICQDGECVEEADCLAINCADYDANQDACSATNPCCIWDPVSYVTPTCTNSDPNALYCDPSGGLHPLEFCDPIGPLFSDPNYCGAGEVMICNEFCKIECEEPSIDCIGIEYCDNYTESTNCNSNVCGEDYVPGPCEWIDYGDGTGECVDDVDIDVGFSDPLTGEEVTCNWNCETTSWTRCDDPPEGVRTRINTCIPDANNPEGCETYGQPISEKPCSVAKKFPFISSNGIIIILILLIGYYLFVNKDKKK